MNPMDVTRETNQKKVIDIVRIGHDTLLKEHEAVQNAVLGIYKFQAIRTPEGSEMVYQYDIANQEEYSKHEMKLISAISAFTPVINQIKNNLYKLEMQVPTDVQTDTPASPTPNLGFMSKLRGTPPKRRVLTKDDPYQDEMPQLRALREKVGRYLIFVEYQSYGISLARRHSLKGMLHYLNIHRTRFKFEMAPAIVTTHRQYVDLMLEKEKEGAIQIAIAKDQEIFKTRNDFNLSPN